MKSLGEKLYEAGLAGDLIFDRSPWSEQSQKTRTLFERAALAFAARLSDAPRWMHADTAPQDGTFFLACQRPDDGSIWFKNWEQWKAPKTLSWRGFHPNRPGKETFRDAEGKPAHFDFWMPLDHLALALSTEPPTNVEADKASHAAQVVGEGSGEEQ